MRVIAGKARRTALVAPPGQETRPTSDRAKEGLFNIISHKIPGAVFLDIFAGGGAIGIEALSRGAKEVVFIEQATAAVSAIATNLSKTKLNGEVMKTSATTAISKLANSRYRFDIIFLDPPYDSFLLEETVKMLDGAGILAKGGLVIAETDESREVNTEVIPLQNLVLSGTRKYGRALFLFFQPLEKQE